MSKESNKQGRGYEYICLKTLYEAIKSYRTADIIENTALRASLSAWETLPPKQQSLYRLSASSAIDTLFALEPNMIEADDKPLYLYLQTDKKGEVADVRDIVIERQNIRWEVGISIKHNHKAVKHSRIAKSLDFGERWYGIPCSSAYWQEVKPVFDYLQELQDRKAKFRDLVDKEATIYLPLLNAFMRELSLQVQKDKGIARRLVEYLLSKYDFYKLISIDSRRISIIQSFNMYGTLNQDSSQQEAEIRVEHIELPNELLYIGFKPKSKTTILMSFDNGWQFSFRLHNAKTLVETSLKFDIQIIGMPANCNIEYICKWRDEAN